MPDIDSPKVVTVPTHWDCECPSNPPYNTYIHPKVIEVCKRCGAKQGDQPDARANEVAQMLRWREHYWAKKDPDRAASFAGHARYYEIIQARGYFEEKHLTLAELIGVRTHADE